MRLVLLGPPGAGKGTQASVIAESHGIPHISTGDILRANLRDETPIGREAKEYMDAGELVPDDVVIRMVADRLVQADTRAGFLFDGFPRTIEQAEALEAVLAGEDTPLDRVVNFSIDVDELVQRLTGRRSCPEGHVYHVDNNPPATPGVCDVDGKELFQREDDTEDVVRNRLEVYHQQTAPLVDFYDQRDLLVTIDADGDVGEVTSRIDRALSSHA
ncbi:adenylate kinase [Salsipaludibacter albus]|uniref:adenylate kinase n=1 Tax=Salsipaludibacter albus TaxID=2849650 RepID=UPI001EE4259C|nr:adenylate kinase [Salsipaludibacter albus]MBY5161583.1 adenylate kinase [Salsipaludibacter albus]